MAYYGTVNGADAYFAQRLHSEGWTGAAAADKPKALNEATQLIDSLNYRGVKHAVWSIMYEYDANSESYKQKLVNTPNQAQILTADQSQELEFPRGLDSTVPTDIEWACYEAALALLEGFDPEDAVERLNIKRQGYASVRTTYADDIASVEYLVYGIPTARIWRWLKPRLSDQQIIKISRAD